MCVCAGCEYNRQCKLLVAKGMSQGKSGVWGVQCSPMGGGGGTNATGKK